MMWDTYDGMGWWMVFGMIWMVVFWGAIIGLIIWGVARATGGGGRRDDETPIETARRRYARGEITREQFEQFRHDLS